MEVTSPSIDAAVTITRPSNTTGYTAGDVLGQADTGTPANAGNAILSFEGVPARAVIESMTLRIDLSSITSGMTTFRLHLYSASPTAILDNAAWDLVAGDRAAYQGFIEVTPADMGATLWAQFDGVNKRVATPSGVLYGLLQTVGAYTPASGTVHVVTLKVVAA